MKKLKNIEFVFLLLIGLIVIFLISLDVIIIFNSYKTQHEVSGHEIRREGIGFWILVLLTLYHIAFFIWQFRLWRKFIRFGVHHYIQLTIVFLLGIYAFSYRVFYTFYVGPNQAKERPVLPDWKQNRNGIIL